jgi:hypothetical protein
VEPRASLDDMEKRKFLVRLNKIILTFKLASSYKKCIRALRMKDRRDAAEELRAILSINDKPPAWRILAKFTDSAHR